MPCQIAALVLIAVGQQSWMLILGCMGIGLFGVTPYLLPPYASLRVPSERLGATTGLLTRGVRCGILLARSVAGLVAVQFGWRRSTDWRRS